MFRMSAVDPSEVVEETLPPSAVEPLPDAEAPVEAEAAPPSTWSKVWGALEGAGLTTEAEGDEAAIPLDDVVSKFLVADELKKHPPGVRVTLRTAALAMKQRDEELAAREADLKKKADEREAAITRREQALQTSRKAFLDLAGNRDLLAKLEAEAKGAEKADSTTEEGRRKVLAAESAKHIRELMTPFAEEGVQVQIALSTQDLEARYPEIKDPSVRDAVHQQINEWDKAWIAQAKAKNLDPDDPATVNVLGSPPSAGRGEEAILHVLRRLARDAEERQRAQVRQVRASAASHVQATTGARTTREPLPTTLPKEWNGRPLATDVDARMAYKEANPEAWANIMRHLRG